MRTIAYIASNLCSIALAAQTIVITFEGTLNGTPIPLDSILVMNLTQGGDTTIYFPDNVLVLGVTGVSEAGGTSFAVQSLPNPFAGTTEIVLEGIGGEMLISLHDVTGRELVSYSANLAGRHRFRVTCERPGIHILTVVQGGVRRSLRLIATEGGGFTSFSIVGGAGAALSKSSRSQFSWTLGDDLRYIGYATSVGVVYSAAIQEIPLITSTRTFVMATGAVCPGSPTVTDIDGNVYPVVSIGNQCWMAENLRTATYAGGSPIPNVVDDYLWMGLSTGAWAHYNNDSQYENPYGKLYNWYAAANPTLCPQGWHVPTDTEWQQLELALGMPTGELGQLGFRGTAQNLGGKMKATTLWFPPNSGATNESGFSSFPGGFRSNSADVVSGLGSYGWWWCATESDADYAWNRFLSYDVAGIDRSLNEKFAGFSVRCVRD